VTKTLTKGSYYTTYEDVAAYWIGFGELPVNYVMATSSTKDTKKAEAYSKYGEAARLWFTYHLTSGYMNQIPSYNTYGDALTRPLITNSIFPPIGLPIAATVGLFVLWRCRMA
jgi:hypothetical protein